MSASEHIETNRRIEREERERTDRGGGAVWPGSGTNRLGAEALSVYAGDSLPVIDSKAGEAGSNIDYTRDDTEPGLKLVADPADDTAENYATLEFTSDGGSPEQRDGLQVKFDPDDFQASSDGLGLASGIKLPAGVITMWGGGAAPGSWLLCDGSAVSRTTYADLFSAIGTAYGVGDGSTTFNLPDFASKFARGNTPGAGGGSDTHGHAVTGTVDNNNANVLAHGAQSTTGNTGHRHTFASGAMNDVTAGGTAESNTEPTHEHSTPIMTHAMGGHGHTFSSGSAASNNNVPAYTGVTFIIKA